MLILSAHPVLDFVKKHRKVRVRIRLGSGLALGLG